MTSPNLARLIQELDNLAPSEISSLKQECCDNAVDYSIRATERQLWKAMHKLLEGVN